MKDSRIGTYGALALGAAAGALRRGLVGWMYGVKGKIYGSHVDILRFICYLNSRHDETIVRTTRSQGTSGIQGIH